MKSEYLPRSVVLASTSARRVQLLSELGVRFSQSAPHIDESLLSGELPEPYVVRMAETKAQVAQSKRKDKTEASVFIGADTTVCFKGVCFGKPADRADFLHMMRTLCGQVHQVLSAVSFLCEHRQVTRISTSCVTLDQLTLKQMHAYWDTGEPLDKAGGYAIQGMGAVFIKRIEGCYTAIMGLPVFETAQLLTAFDVPWVLSP